MAGMAQPQPQQCSGGTSATTSADSRGKDCSSEGLGQGDSSGSHCDDEESEQVSLPDRLLAGYVFGWCA